MADKMTYADTAISRLHQMTKILAIFMLGLCALVWPDFTLGLVLVIVLFAVSFVARISGDFAKVMLGFGIPLTVMVMFIQGLYSPKNHTVIANFGFAQLGLEGILYAAKVVMGLLVFLGSFTIMNKTTYAGALVAALTSAGLNAKVGYLILASLNVVPQMQRRMSIIREAQNARGLSENGSLFSRIAAYVPLLGPVVMSSLTDAQERGMTLETRGFGITDVKQTSYVEVRWRTIDKMWNLMLVVMAVIVTVLSAGMRIGVIPFSAPWAGA